MDGDLKTRHDRIGHFASKRLTKRIARIAFKKVELRNLIALYPAASYRF